MPNTLDEIVEVMARAIYDCADKGLDEHVGFYEANRWDGDRTTCLDGYFDLRAFARAALAALEAKGFVVRRAGLPEPQRAYLGECPHCVGYLGYHAPTCPIMTIKPQGISHSRDPYTAEPPPAHMRKDEG